MKRAAVLMIVLVVIAAIAGFFLRPGKDSQSTDVQVETPVRAIDPMGPVATTQVVTMADIPDRSMPPAASQPKLPAGWEDFSVIKETERLKRVTAAMSDRNLPTNVLTFFAQELFNREHLDVTRNNMANALVWQENPDPKLHELFLKMLEDETENPVWRDYCLQFISECLKSTSEPGLVKETLVRYSQGKDTLAGTAIVQLAYQEGEGRMHLGDAFSEQVEAQLKDPEVAVPTKMSILAIAGSRKDGRLLPLARTFAKDKNDGLMRCAIAAIGQMGSAEDLPLVQAGLSHTNRAVQLAAKGAEQRIRSRYPHADK